MRLSSKSSIGILCALFCLSGGASAEVPDSRASSKAAKRPHAGITAQDQAKGSERDVEITRKIREKIVEEPKLSTAAKNVQIITLNGAVTVKGETKNSLEVARVLEIAKGVAGTNSVSNEMTVDEKR